MHIDITICCVYDGKEETYGTGMGFVVPEDIAKRIRREGSDLSRVLKEIAGLENIGRKQGALGYFSAGVLHRSEQIEQSVACAFVPRLHKARAANSH
jgi:inosine/xanthosine triphosphatase